MKICLVSPQYPGYGGYGVYILYLMRGLREKGYEVHTLTGPPPSGQSAKEADCHIVATGYEGFRFVNFEFQVNQRLRELCRNEDFELIHYNLPVYFGIPIFHPPTLPLLITGHGVTIDLMRKLLHYRPRGLDLGDILYFAGGPIIPQLERWAFSKANRVIAVSEWIKSSLVRDYGLPFERITTIHNGVDTKRFRPVANAKEKITRYVGEGNEGRPIVLYLARLMGAKDPATLVQAIPQILESHADALFLFRGEGLTLPGNLKSQLTRSLPPNSYRVIEFVSSDDLPVLYSAASAYVLPSIYEPFPFTLLEAMACGAPVIASAVGGISEMIEHVRSGILVGAKNSSQLAEAIIKVLSDAKLASRLGSEARKRVEERFNLNLFLSGIEREIRQLAS